MARPIRVEFDGALYHAGYPSEKSVYRTASLNRRKGNYFVYLSLARAGTLLNSKYANDEGEIFRS